MNSNYQIINLSLILSNLIYLLTLINMKPIWTFLLTLFFSLLHETLTASSVTPVWITNTYFETRPAAIKENVATSFSSANPITITIPFTKTYTLTPQLAFGLKNYRGISTF